tara:strand:+ start:141 stop:644 length:504 start_codon:yes stop_codon:yes gene_type:complete
MNYHKELKNLIWLRDSESISKDEFDRRRKELFNSKNKLDGAKEKLLNDFNHGNYFKIEEVNIYFSPVNPRSPIAKLITKEDRLDFLQTKRVDNINNGKPINHKLPESHEEGEAIAKMIEEGKSRDSIINFFQRSESVLTEIIKKKIDGDLESNDPYVLAAMKILDKL